LRYINISSTPEKFIPTQVNGLIASKVLTALNTGLIVCSTLSKKHSLRDVGRRSS